jgi:putative hemolysin
VQDIYLPWTQVVFVREDQSFDEVELLIASSGHTRIPVTSNGSVLGVVNAKELFALRKAGGSDWRAILRSPVRVSEGDTLLATLKAMQDRRSHLSIVVGPSSERIGIVTMEDILEEIIGDIFDEDDDDGAVRRLLSRPASRGRGVPAP